MACSLDGVTTIAFAFPPILFLVISLKISIIIAVFCPILCGCSDSYLWIAFTAFDVGKSGFSGVAFAIL